MTEIRTDDHSATLETQWAAIQPARGRYIAEDVDGFVGKLVQVVKTLEGRLANTTQARDQALQQIHEIAGHDPSATWAPLKAKELLRSAQVQADQYMDDAEAYARSLMADAEAANAEARIAEALTEPEWTGDDVADAEAFATWRRAALDYIRERQAAERDRCAHRLERMQRALEAIKDES